MSILRMAVVLVHMSFLLPLPKLFSLIFFPLSMLDMLNSIVIKITLIISYIFLL